jgi:hypothetical protein
MQGKDGRSGQRNRGKAPVGKKEDPIEDEGFNKSGYGILLRPYDMPVRLRYNSRIP